MQLIILGSGTGIPVHDRASPSILLHTKNRPMLFDIGPGTLRQLACIGLDFRDLGHIFITHFHPDHSADLVHLLFATRNPSILASRRPFVITGPLGLKDFLQGLQNVYGNWIKLPPEILTIEERVTEKRETGQYKDVTVISQPVSHTAQSLAYRVEGPNGKSFVYSGDTGLCEGIISLAEEADVLILESSFPNDQEVEGHLTPFLAGRIATLAKVPRLVLLHFYPEVLKTDIASQCRKSFTGELILARDLLSLKV